MLFHFSCIFFFWLLLIIHTLASAPKTRRGWFRNTNASSRVTPLESNETSTISSLNDTKRSTTSSNATNVTTLTWKETLPPPLNIRKTLHRIIIPLSSSTNATVYLLGTSHVSNDSSADVRLLLNEVSPDVVFLELCDQRIPMLTSNSHELSATADDDMESATNMTFWQKVQQIQSASGMSKGSAMGTLLLTQVQDDYADSLGVELGGEFKVAWTYCLARKPIVILGDRPLQITLVRAWESLTLFGKVKVLTGLLWSLLQKPKPDELRAWMQTILENGEKDVLTESMAELKKSFPSLELVILKERDAYLACKLYQTCRYLDRSQDQTIVAIVGAGHTAGICEWLTNGNGHTPEEILRDRLHTKKWRDQDLEALVHEVTQLPVENAGFL